MMADIEVKDLTLMTADITATDVIPIVDVSTGETLKTTTQQLMNTIGSLAIKTGNGGDIGGYLMDGVNDYITVSDDANLDFELSDFSLELFVRLADYTPSAEKVLIEKHASNLGYKLLLTTAGKLKLQFGNGTNFTTFSYESDATGVTDDSWAHFFITADRDGNALFYVNGILNKTVDISGSVAQTLDNAGALNIFGNGTSYTVGRVAIVREYNRVLTATETASIYNNGRPDLYELPFSDRGASSDLVSGVDFTSASWVVTGGSVTKVDGNSLSITALGEGVYRAHAIVGKVYKIVTSGLVSGSIRLLDGGTILKTYTTNFSETFYYTAASTVFYVRSGAAGINTVDDFVLQVYPIGNVVAYLSPNAGSLGWIESSGNQLSGSTSGSPICLTKEARPPHYRDIRKAIAANTNTTLTSVVPRGYKIVSIRAKGSDSLADIKIGSASAGEQIVAATTTSSTTPKLLTLASTANDAYSESADVTLYARHDTSASGKTMDLIFHFEKVGN